MNCFISYSRHDQDTALRLQLSLMRRGFNVFVAQNSVRPGRNWSREIREVLREADVLVALDSPRSRKSSFVQQEVGMALDSGAIIVPVSLDGKLDCVPGWLEKSQAISGADFGSVDQLVEHVATEVSTIFGTVPPELTEPRTVADYALRATLQDCFSDPDRAGAWSRQCDRYTRLYYGEEGTQRQISRGTSLTFTGMITERLVKFQRITSKSLSQHIKTQLNQTVGFLLDSQDEERGGFGPKTKQLMRGDSVVRPHIRHTCWAIRALLAIDEHKFAEEIGRGLRWLEMEVPIRAHSDRWCWTAAVLLSLATDKRLLRSTRWRRAQAVWRHSVELDLTRSFVKRWQSWVKSEPHNKRNWLSIDNALYVLNCLNDREGLSTELRQQMQGATLALFDRVETTNDGSLSCGLPLFSPGRPEVGASAQLFEISSQGNSLDRAALADFIVRALAESRSMSSTFTWHLSALLSCPDLYTKSLRNVRETTKHN